MRKTLLPSLVLAFLALFLIPPHRASAQDVTVSYQSFYDELSPYGQWIADSEYGYVWVPNVDDEFRPYFTDGFWAWTEYGNTWVSDYPWGWAAFHYGRWIFNEYYGWIWVPGTTWSPGWVAWRWGGGFYGWAPLMPGMEWNGGEYVCAVDWWVFMHPNHLYKHHYNREMRADFLRGPRHTALLLKNSKPSTAKVQYNGVNYVCGPRPEYYKKNTGKDAPVYHYQAGTAKGKDFVGGATISTFRPGTVVAEIPNTPRPAPKRIIPAQARVNSPGSQQNGWRGPRQFKVQQRAADPGWNRVQQPMSAPYHPSVMPRMEGPRPSGGNAPHPSGGSARPSGGRK